MVITLTLCIFNQARIIGHPEVYDYMNYFLSDSIDITVHCSLNKQKSHKNNCLDISSEV